MRGTPEERFAARRARYANPPAPPMPNGGELPPEPVRQVERRPSFRLVVRAPPSESKLRIDLPHLATVLRALLDSTTADRVSVGRNTLHAALYIARNATITDERT